MFKFTQLDFVFPLTLVTSLTSTFLLRIYSSQLKISLSHLSILLVSTHYPIAKLLACFSYLLIVVAHFDTKICISFLLFCDKLPQTYV